MLVDRSRLDADPGRRWRRRRPSRRSINRIAPGQDYLIDNISNTLEVARDDAAVGKRMFFFLGLPGRPAGRLPRRLRRQHPGQRAATRQRQPPPPRRPPRPPAPDARSTGRWYSPASARSSGAGLGLLSVMVILGGGTLFDAAGRGPGRVRRSSRSRSGMLTTAFALYIPGRRSLSREVSQERRGDGADPAPAWRTLAARPRPAVAVAADRPVIALARGAFDAAAGLGLRGSVGVAAVLPDARAAGGLGGRHAARGALLQMRSRPGSRARGAAVRPAGPRHPEPQPQETLLGARHRDVGVGLVVAFGVSLAIFAVDLRRREGGGRAGSSSARTCASRRACSAAGPIRRARRPARGPGRGGGGAGGLQARERGPHRPVQPGPSDLAAIDPASFAQRRRALGLALRRPPAAERHGGAAGRPAAACSSTPDRPTSCPSRRAIDVQVLLARGTKSRR